MNIKNICTKKTYQKNGETKTIWLKVGSIKSLDDGKQFIELNMFPETSFYVFEPKSEQDSF